MDTAAHQASTTTAATSRRGRKYFGIEEANASLTYLRRIVDDITACYHEAVDVRERIEAPREDDNLDQLKTQYESFMDRLNELIDELHQVGVELKDFEKGLLNFPSMHEGREIYLCWQRGEEVIRCWHEVNTGYATRQDIALLQSVKAEQAA